MSVSNSHINILDIPYLNSNTSIRDLIVIIGRSIIIAPAGPVGGRIDTTLADQVRSLKRCSLNLDCSKSQCTQECKTRNDTHDQLVAKMKVSERVSELNINVGRKEK